MTEEITPVTIEDKMKDSYLSYSLSVIVGRALPDVRDGLKPVHRRILYASNELGLTHEKPHKKSARIVGEVLGKFHPHGDAAVYDTMVRMAQQFNQRYLLIDGHGNFGSIDGDSPAAMRYTEVRMTHFSEMIMEDLKKDTVDFTDNFDGSLQEPRVLPSRIPNLLVNGSSGIAVGMSTSIPPHNLNEVIDALKYLLKQPNARIDTLMNYIKGPDFPTGAKIIGSRGIKRAFKTGKGKIKIRANTNVEKAGRKEHIIIDELPYQVNKARLIENIADLINKGKFENISDLRDESDQDGLRVVLELKQGADSQIVLNRLYKYTDLQTSFRINLLALVDNRPVVMSLKDILQHFIDFRRQVITRRTEFELKKARERHLILKGLIRAIDKLDLVISIIRSSRSTGEANERLQQALEITEEQAEAILKMQLRRLVGMETDKLKDEISDLAASIASFEAVLNSKEQLDKVVRNELNEIKKKFGDDRKTEIIDDEEKAIIEKQDLIKEKDAVLSLSYRMNIKRTETMDNLRAGKNDYIIDLCSGISYNNVLFFVDTGQVYSLPIHKISEHHGLSTGDSINKFIKIPLNENIVSMICLNDTVRENYITIATKNGMVKKTIGEEYQTKYSSIKAVNLKDDDQVIDVAITDGKKDILLGTRNGRAILFTEESINDTGRNTIGSIGISLAEDDRVINMNTIEDDNYIVSISDNGKGNKINIKEFNRQNRNGKGVKTVSSSNYKMASIISAKLSDKLLLINKDEKIYTINVDDIAETQRPGYMYNILGKDNEIITAVYKLPYIDIDEE